MENALPQFIYSDKHRIPVNLTVIFSLGVAGFGLYTMFFGQDGAIRAEFIVLLGLGTAIYSWLTNPRVYLVYSDALYIMYGRPRIKKIPFDNISHLEMRQLATPDRLRVWPVQGRRVVLMARDPETFHDQLQQALDDYRHANPDLYIPELPEGPEPDAPESPDYPDNPQSDASDSQDHPDAPASGNGASPNR